MITFCVYVLIFIFIIIHFIFKNTVKIEIGKPPIDSLFIAYKYSNRGWWTNFSLFRSDKFGSPLSSMRLYYTDQLAQNIEFAHGVVLNDSGLAPDDHLLFEAKKRGFSFIKTPVISHAIYVVFPIFLNLAITKMFAIFVGYPKIREISEERNLCGYPVLEIYSKHSVLLIVPLVHQDEFVVNEAELIVYGKQISTLFSLRDRVKYLLNSINISKQPFIVEYLRKSKGLKLVKRETKG